MSCKTFENRFMLSENRDWWMNVFNGKGTAVENPRGWKIGQRALNQGKAQERVVVAIDE